jgi:imidazolonepropionase-like amidohydrolase
MLLTGGLVFDGTGAPPAEAEVLIEGGRIVEVGTGLDGDEAVDVGGRHLLPGLFDCHTHVTLTSVDLMGMLQAPFSYRFFQTVQNLAATLRAGITTVRDAAGADAGVKRAVADGLVPGPRLQISVTLLSQTGGHGDGWFPSGQTLDFWPVYPGMPDGLVDGPRRCGARSASWSGPGPTSSRSRPAAGSCPPPTTPATLTSATTS